MKEDDYILVKNLTKIRMLGLLMRDLLPQSDRDETDLRMMLRAIELWEARLSKDMKITP